MPGTPAAFTAAELIKASGEYDLSFVLRLDASGIPRHTSLGDSFAKMTGLHTLSLRGHAVQNLRPLGQLPRLTMLDLSLNGITDLGPRGCDLPCADLPNLKRLDLRGNDLCAEYLEPLASLLGDLDALEYLWLQTSPGDIREDVLEDLLPQGAPYIAARSLLEAPHRAANPMCKAESYQDVLLAHLPTLTALDGEDLRLKRACGALWHLGEPDNASRRELDRTPWLPKWRNRWGRIIPTEKLPDAAEHDDVRDYGVGGGDRRTLEELARELAHTKDAATTALHDGERWLCEHIATTK